MMKLKNLFLLVIALVVFVGLGAANVKAEGKVKVYVFEAGGCPYCEAEVEYLQGLSSYGEKFEIIRKELYIDHVNWVPGADYEIGEKTANAFKEAGFKDATVSGTPFVVISDLYAASAYSTELEDIIDEAYEKGDTDVVGCFENGGTDCLPNSSNGTEIIATVVVIIAIVGVITLLCVSRVRSTYDAAYAYDTVDEAENKNTQVVENNSYKEEVRVEKATKKVYKKNKH
jgi:hypothetical protein